jgi:hypothetical protein
VVDESFDHRFFVEEALVDIMNIALFVVLAALGALYVLRRKGRLKNEND